MPDRHDRTSLHIAAKMNAAEAITALCGHGANKNGPDRFDNAPIHFAIAGRGRLASVVALLNAGVDANLHHGAWESSPLHTAATAGNAEVVRVLIRHGVDTSTPDSRGRTALHHAADRNAVGVIDALASTGGDVNARDGDGWTPLHHACSSHAFGAVEALLRNGVNVNSPDSDEQLPLHRAACESQQDSSLAINDLLLKWGADESAVDANGCNAEEVLGMSLQCEYGLEVPPANARISKLLAKAPVERSWRHQRLFVVSRGRPDKVRPALEDFETPVGGIVTTRSVKLVKAAAGGGASEIEHVVARVVGLAEKGVFRHLMSFL